MYGKIALFKRVVNICRVHYSKDRSSKKLLEFLANMPKDSSQRIEDTQRIRINMSKKKEKMGSSTIYLQVVGSGARGVPNTLYLFTDQTRYLFNCGEGTQRLSHEHKIKLGKLGHIFITSKTWRNIGGLPGLSLTLQDVGIPCITLHGPEGLDELYNATKRFIIIKDMNVKMAKCHPSDDFSDNVMSVKYVLLGPEENVLENDPKPAAKRAKLNDDNVDKAFEKFIHDDTDYYNKSFKNNQADKYKTHRNRMGSPEKVNTEPTKTKSEKVLEDLQKKSNCTVAYICTFRKRYGTLDLKKCVERGVKPGPLLGKLKMGEDVVLPDGTLVFSKDVKTPDDPGPVLIVLEVPDLSYLKEAEFSAHFANGSNPPENIPAVIVHFTPPHVFHHPTYRAFMSMFGLHTRHLVVNTQNSCMGSEAVHRTQNKLHLLDPDIFPMLKDLSIPAVWHAHPPVTNSESPTKIKGLEELKNKIALAQFQNIINMEGSCKGDGTAEQEEPTGNKLEIFGAHTLSIVQLRPKQEFDRQAEPKLMIQDYIQETMDVDGFATSLEQFRKLVDKVRYAKNGSQKEYPKLVFLGTGSCIPSKTRNTSAIVLHVDENSSMLLDCGEGTFGQLVRFYGPKRVNAFLRTLKGIYISHLHADHHIGVIGVLQARREAMEEVQGPGAVIEPVHLLAPGQIVSWLCTYDEQFERIREEFALLPLQNLLATTEGEVSSGGEVPSAVLAALGVRAVRTCMVAHCPNAFGVAIVVDGHKITYSGDTIPCDDLVKIGKDSTLLIHEATMEDELADEARTKMHSTTSQAIEVGRRMRARYTLLTHFSQRYARLPRLNAHILNDNNSVGIAFDNMQITMSDLELLPHMYAPLQLMFAEHCVDLETKAAQRAIRRARASSQSPSRFPSGTHGYSTHARNSSADRGTDRSNHPPFDKVSRKPDNIPVANSAPVQRPPSPSYRDSNASRLRQEIRRSHGPAPTKRRRKRSRSGSCSSAVSANSATPTSLNSENASPERPVEVPMVRATSETSNLDKEERSKVISKGHVIDTRSKTLNSTAAAPSSDKVPDKKINTTNSTLSTPPKEARSGYGKPLVTPIHKHLVIRKCVQNGPSSPCNEKILQTPPSPPVNRCRSPIKSWRAENRISCTSIASNKRDVSKSKLLKIPRVDVVTSILVHMALWRVYRLVSNLSYVQWQLLVTVISVGILFWTATKETVSGIKPRWPSAGLVRPELDRRPKSGAPISTQKTSVAFAQQRHGASPRRASSAERKPQDTKSLTHTNAPTYERSVKSWNAGTRTPAGSSPRSQTPTGLRQRFKEESNIRYPAMKLPDRLNDKQKKHVLNGSKAKFSNHNSKSFKPQLEDIKSSYLLLNNKKPINRNIDTPVNDEKPKAPTPPMDDNLRRLQLMEIKQKYKSKTFWSDSKYDKIEGLNWISWK